MRSKIDDVRDWLEARLPLTAARDFSAKKTVPVHRYSVIYYLGGMTMFFFIVQVLTGILLMLYYRPAAESAFESVEFIMTTVPFGWLIRSIHSWSANLMVFFAFVHLATVYFSKAYRSPRELTWVTGCLVFFLTLAFGFSGYLLPWNQLAFFATKVGTDIAGAVPVIGEWLLRFLRGGDRVTGGTLSRFYGWHVAILPAITGVLLGIHLLLVQIQGMSVPPGQVEEAARRRPMKFLPNFALRDLFGWVLALGVLAAIAALFPWELGDKADPFAPAFKNIRPEWYFMFMFETLKLVPGGEIMGLEYEAIPILGFSLAGLLLVLVPFLDRRGQETGRSPLFTRIGVLALIYMVALTAWGYRSLVPVYIVLLTGVVMAVLGLGTRRVPKGGAMIVFFLAPLALFLAPRAGAAQEIELAATSCVTCHADADLFEEASLAILEGFREDIHAELGLSCHDCHGGDPAADPEDMFAAKDEERSVGPYLGIPEKADIPSFCGRCHSDPAYMRRFKPDARIDQEREYWTSGHGMALADGDTRVATCVDCHGVHGVQRAGDPRSSVYPTRVAETCNDCHGDADRMTGSTVAGGRELPIDQFAKWSRSVHAEALLVREDLSAPTCNDCHGNHGAAPPGVDSVGFVCGQCHGREAEIFRGSPKHEGFLEHNEFLAEAGEEGCAACHEDPEPQAALTGISSFGECASCHGNHGIVRPTVGMFSPPPPTPCAFCHGEIGDSAESQEMLANHLAVKDDLLARAAAEGVSGPDLFDWLIDKTLTLPNHVSEADVTEGEPPLRPEFERLFTKFRLGKSYYTYQDPTTGGEVRAAANRCDVCHGAEPLMADEPLGHMMSRAILDRMVELTSATAEAERILLKARRGGVETRHALLEIDQAVDAQIGLEVLVHGFALEEDGPFLETHATGLEHAGAALAAGREALDQLAFRRRGLAVSLLVITVLLVSLGLKIRQISRDG